MSYAMPRRSLKGLSASFAQSNQLAGETSGSYNHCSRNT